MSISRGILTLNPPRYLPCSQLKILVESFLAQMLANKEFETISAPPEAVSCKKYF